MKDHSIFNGLKELRGNEGCFRIMLNRGQVFKLIKDSYVFIGTVKLPKTNKALYEKCCSM